MKMFKLLTTTLLVVLCIGFVSCSKSDDEPTSSIIGSWEDAWQNQKDCYIFNTDNSYSFYKKIDGKIVKEYTGNYTFNQSTLEGIMTSNQDTQKMTFKFKKDRFGDDIIIITWYFLDSGKERTENIEYLRTK